MEKALHHRFVLMLAVGVVRIRSHQQRAIGAGTYSSSRPGGRSCLRRLRLIM